MGELVENIPAEGPLKRVVDVAPEVVMKKNPPRKSGHQLGQAFLVLFGEDRSLGGAGRSSLGKGHVGLPSAAKHHFHP